MNIKNLWPDSFDVSNIESPPVQVLESQAKLLPKLTNDIAYAHVESDLTAMFIRLSKTSKKYDFVYSFTIKSKFLDDFDFWVFTIAHSIDFYPVAMVLDEDIFKQVDFATSGLNLTPSNNKNIILDDLPTLEGVVGKILKSEKVYRVVTSIMKLSVT